jgi:nitroimidazol reductase NimA-like FMN-containing flavoprotein (pyridoxamine 5'-phosphate oxidase superfamily)
MSESPNVTELHVLDCWERLRSRSFGRLAHHLTNEVHIVPVNYAVRGHDILFRTAEGEKLLGVVMNDDVAFETDEVLDHTAWSVVARGRARVLREDEVDALGDDFVHPWVDYPKYDVVAIAVHTITCRQFVLDRTDYTPSR